MADTITGLNRDRYLDGRLRVPRKKCRHCGRELPPLQPQ